MDVFGGCCCIEVGVVIGYLNEGEVGDWWLYGECGVDGVLLVSWYGVVEGCDCVVGKFLIIGGVCGYEVSGYGSIGVYDGWILFVGIGVCEGIGWCV